MWLQLSQILKIFTEETGENQHLFFYGDVTKIQKTRVVQALRASLHVRMRTVAENLRLSFEVHEQRLNRYFRNISSFIERKD